MVSEKYDQQDDDNTRWPLLEKSWPLIPPPPPTWAHLPLRDRDSSQPEAVSILRPSGMGVIPVTRFNQSVGGGGGT